MTTSMAACTCYVKTLSLEAHFCTRWGAHALTCPAYHESLDPVDRLHDKAQREAQAMTNTPAGKLRLQAVSSFSVEAKFDYDNQAWIVNGLYVRCGHQGPCQCYGREHEGEQAPSIH